MEKLARTQYSPEFRVAADSKHNLPIAANVLKRKFAVNAPNQAWVSDISYIHTDEGWLYLMKQLAIRLSCKKRSKSLVMGNAEK